MSEWTYDIEDVLDKIRINSTFLSAHHKKRFIEYADKIKYYRIPVLILSASASVFSIAGTHFLPQSQVSLGNCGLGLIAGIITSIELFYNIAENMKSELQSSRAFYALSVDIYKTLALLPSNRNPEARSYLEQCFTEYLKLTEQSNILEKNVTDYLQPITDAVRKSAKQNKSLTTLSSNELPPQVPNEIGENANESVEMNAIENAV